MIKNFKQFESLLDKLQGPTDDEVKKNIMELSNLDIQLKSAIKIGYIDGINYALENGANTDYIHYNYIIKLINILDMSDIDIIDMLSTVSYNKAFIILVAVGKTNLIKNTNINISGNVIHSNDDLPIKIASENNDYKTLEFLFSLDDFNYNVLRLCLLDIEDDKVRKLLLFHMDNRQIHAIKHMCKLGDVDMVEKMLRSYHLTNEGIEECIKVTTDKEIIEILEKCMR